MSKFLNNKLLINNHFENVGAFENLIKYNLKKGYSYPILDYDSYLKQCKQDCSIIDPINIEECNEYCSLFVKNIRDSINFSRLDCKTYDVPCCIKKSNNNPLALYNCLDIKSISTNKIPSIQDRYIILQVLFSFFFICFIILLFLFIIKK